MKKDIKDYMSFYIGGRAMVRFGRMEPTVRRISLINLYTWFGSALQKTDYIQYYDIKPILRPLSDMTEEEWYVLHSIDRYADIVFETFTGEGTRYLLSKGFDLFGLIEAGLAIDATTLKKEV